MFGPTGILASKLSSKIKSKNANNVPDELNKYIQQVLGT